MSGKAYFVGNATTLESEKSYFKPQLYLLATSDLCSLTSTNLKFFASIS